MVCSIRTRDGDSDIQGFDKLAIESLSKIKDQYVFDGFVTLDPETAYRNALECGIYMILVDDNLLGFNIASPWWSDEPILSEEIVCPGIAVETVVSIIQEFAVANNVRHLEVGTRAVREGKHPAMRRLFQRHGFKESYTALRKIHEQGSQESTQGS